MVAKVRGDAGSHLARAVLGGATCLSRPTRGRERGEVVMGQAYRGQPRAVEEPARSLPVSGRQIQLGNHMRW